MFVAEAKFRKQTDEYRQLIARQVGAGKGRTGAALQQLGARHPAHPALPAFTLQDAGAIMELLTDRAVELKVVERVQLKAATFGQDLSASGGGGGDGPAYKVRPEVVAQLYEHWVMPLTKEVEVQYLLRRLDGGA